MKTIKKRLNYNINFKVWRDYEILDKYKNIIIKFIDNDILEKDKDLFKEIYLEYKETVKNFYIHINKTVDGIEWATSWNLDFIKRELILDYNENEKFDIDIFALKNLQLLAEFELKIKGILLEEE